ncbi:hypothetical protein V2J09_009740 [Rumex salicifolius]
MKSKMIHCQTCGIEEHSLDLVIYCTLCEEIMVHRFCVDGSLIYGHEHGVWFCDECSPRFSKVVQCFDDGSKVPHFEAKKLDNDNCEGDTSLCVPLVPSTSIDLDLKTENSLLSPLELKHDKTHVLNLEPESSAPIKPEDVAVDADSKGRIIVSCDGRLEQVLRCENLDELFNHYEDHVLNHGHIEQVHPCENSDGLFNHDEDHVLNHGHLEKVHPCENLDDLSNHDKDHVLNQGLESGEPSRPKNLVEVITPKFGKSIHSNGCHEPSPKHLDLFENMGGFTKSLPNEDNISNSIGCLKGQNDTCVHTDGLEGLVDSSQMMLSSLERVLSLPKDDISWRGKCRISHQMGYSVSFELKAHLSTSSSSNVVEAAQTLPMTLDLEMVPKTKSWPKRFDELQPSDEDIGLYFFPMHVSDEKLCSGLFDKMMKDDLVLKFARYDFKLQMFTSFDLPKEICRYNGKSYLWGVFSSPTTSSSSNATQVREQQHSPKHTSESVCITKVMKFGYEKKVKRQCIPLGHCLPGSQSIGNRKRKHDGNAHQATFASSPTRIPKLKHVSNARQAGIRRQRKCIDQALPASRTPEQTDLMPSSLKANVSKRCSNESFSSLRIGMDVTEKLHVRKREPMTKATKPRAWWSSRRDSCHAKQRKAWNAKKERRDGCNERFSSLRVPSHIRGGTVGETIVMQSTEKFGTQKKIVVPNGLRDARPIKQSKVWNAKERFFKEAIKEEPHH